MTHGNEEEDGGGQIAAGLRVVLRHKAAAVGHLCAWLCVWECEKAVQPSVICVGERAFRVIR